LAADAVLAGEDLASMKTVPPISASTTTRPAMRTTGDAPFDFFLSSAENLARLTSREPVDVLF
jgi:hypothetical protein